jgi:hypothetical protein
VIEPKGGPGVELATLEDAARFMGKMRPFRQGWPHWDYAAELVLIAATTGEEADIERATAQMERALQVEGLVVMNLRVASLILGLAYMLALLYVGGRYPFVVGIAVYVVVVAAGPYITRYLRGHR